MARDSSSGNNNGILAACVTLLQWIVLTVVATVKRGVRFFCRACASSTASKSASAECIDLEAGGIVVATPEAVCGDEDREEQDETTRAFETIDVIVIADMQKPNANDGCERIEIVVVGESTTGASESCTEQGEEEGEGAPSAVVGVDAVMTESESEDKDKEDEDDEDEDTVDESENDSTPAHSAWSSEEEGDAAADTQLDFDLDTVSDGVSSSSPVSSHFTTSEDGQDTKAPLMTGSTRIDGFEEISSRLDQQQGQREQEHEMEPEPEFSEIDSSDDDESKMPVGLDVKSQKQDDADSELDMVTDTSLPFSAAASSGSDCKFEEDDEESPTTASSSSTVDDSEDAEALYHEQQQPEQETTDNSSEEEEEEEEDQRARMEPTAVDVRTTTTRLKSYHATTIHVDNREHNRRLLKARAKALRYSDSLEYKQMRAANLARRAALRKAAAAKSHFLF